MTSSLPRVRTGVMRGFPRVAGVCPACDRETLGLGVGGYVTCTTARCPDPRAASRALAAL